MKTSTAPTKFTAAFLAVVLCALPASAETRDLHPTDDAMLDQQAPDTNWGSATELRVRNADNGVSTDQEMSLTIRFDLSEVLPAPIGSAILYVYYHDWENTNPVGRSLACRRITSDWDEDTVTWNTQPGRAALVTDLGPLLPASPGSWQAWGVTGDVQDFVDGAVTNHGWIITDEMAWGAPDIPIAKFRSKEYGGLTPYLHLSGVDFDCNSNGIADGADLTGGTSADCNADLVPDECQLAGDDCNTNRVPDGCDIASGTSADCNTNGVPDECDISGGTSADCNTNGIPDECDIGDGMSDDCNGDGIPDECSGDCNGNEFPDALDICYGTSQDCNDNIVPDECESQEDCQSNGIQDICDLAAATSADCNADGVPNECEPPDDCQPNGVQDICDIAAGTSEDCNANGEPDECEPPDDCQPNGVPDICDLAAGTSADCDGDEFPDECSIATGTSMDCNGDGVPDECSGDCNDNGVLDAWEICFGASLDCNANLIPDQCEPQGDCQPNDVQDICDIAAGTSADCDGDSVPDECSGDCNGNAIPDAQDICAGTSEDCDADVVPDECSGDCNLNEVPDAQDICYGTSQDCDDDGIPDECSDDCNGNELPDVSEICYGTSQDCNVNGVPDACDIDAGTSVDCQPNGIPDECELALLADLVLEDDFDDGVLDPAWTVTLVDASAWVFDESATDSTKLTVSSITPTVINQGDGGIWAQAVLAQTVALVGDFLVELDCSWNSGGSVRAVQRILVTLYTPGGEMVARGGYYDAWISYDAGKYAEIGDLRRPPERGELEPADSGTVAIERRDQTVIVSWNGTAILTGTSALPVATVAVSFGNYGYDGPGGMSVFGSEAVDRVRLVANAGECNGNGVPDECDIAWGTSADCNANGVPDECDIAAGTSVDNNGNGVPDECGFYVDDSATTGANNGTSWDDAFTKLQSALAVVSAGDKIRVAQGTYRPDEDAANPNGTGDRTASFRLRDGVTLVGGYAGTGTVNPNERNVALYETVLSGDLDVNDAGTNGRSENSYHVVWAGADITSSGILDGFTITGGNADGAEPHDDGGGMFNSSGAPTLTHCVFTANSAAFAGGGMYNRFVSSPTLTNCRFLGNSAGLTGGGMANLGPNTPTLTNCTLTGNSAVSSGGGIAQVGPGAGLTATNCIVWGNVAPSSPQISGPGAIAYSNVEGGRTGTGNIDVDPLFVRDPSAGLDATWGTGDDDYGDLHLLWGSPCVDAGTNAPAGGLPPTDEDGKPRPVDGDGDGIAVADMGTYERASAIFVDDGATAGANAGTSWDDAFTKLQSALNVAGEGDEIRVGQGTYRPDEDLANPNGTGDRTASFRLVDAVAIYGGHAGTGLVNPNERNVAVYETILSGDLAGDDMPTNGPDFTHNGENAHHVVWAGEGVASGALLDGFTITGGNANAYATPPHGEGGGMYNSNGFPTLANCTFRGNAADSDGSTGGGGGLFNWSGGPTLTNCAFRENSGDYGGGMGGRQGWPTLTNCTFSSNSAEFQGGGIYRWGGALTLTNCTFTGNSSVAGGGMLNHQSPATLTNCTFSGNSADYGGGISGGGATQTLTNCTFSANSADVGGGMHVYSGVAATLTNCILWGNVALTGPQIQDDESVTVVEYSNVEGGWAGTGNIDVDPLFVAGPVGWLYLSQTAAGQPHQSPCVDVGTSGLFDATTTTTRRDEIADTNGFVDIGYHYPVTGDPFVRGDFDYDGDVDLVDYARLNACLTAPCAGAPCTPFVYDQPWCNIVDFDDDGDVDLLDFGAFQSAFTG